MDFFLAILAYFKSDPPLLLCVLIIGGCFYFILRKESYCEQLSEAISDTNESMARLVTLIETLVFRGRKGDDL